MGVQWVAFVPAAVVVSVIPGANQLLSLRNAVRQGTADASFALLGRFAAFAVLVAAVAVGFGAILTSSATAFGIVKWAGVAYLGWLAVSALYAVGRRAPEPAAAPLPDRAPAPERRERGALARQEFLVAITNPKALLLFAAFLPQFVSGPAPGPAQIAVLGAAYIAIEAVSALAYTVLGGRLGHGEFSARAQRRLDGVCGAAFLGLAGALALEQRP